MSNLRKHGQPPFNVAVIHGGPGARGEMYPVACELSSVLGVLEPMQSACSVEGQVAELKSILESCGNTPLILVGFSWGAWLSYILAAYYPDLVRKLILVSSGVFEEKYSLKIMDTRLSRLRAEEKNEVLSLLTALQTNVLDNNLFARFGELMGKADSFDPLPEDSQASNETPNIDIYKRVWGQASHLRSNGQLLQLGERIRCPVIAIHGDYDSGPAEGVKDPLSRVLTNFRFILLEKCGHYPWLERNAKDSFYSILRKEVPL